MCLTTWSKLRTKIEILVNEWKQMWKFCLCREGVLFTLWCVEPLRMALQQQPVLPVIPWDSLYLRTALLWFCLFEHKQKTEWLLYNVQLRIFANSVQLVRLMQWVHVHSLLAWGVTLWQMLNINQDIWTSV